MTLEEERKVTEAWVNWHIKKGCINSLPDKPTLEDYQNLLEPEIVAQITELEGKKEISHKTAVFLMQYYMVKQWWQQQPISVKDQVAAVLN
jgi:hypothetical protein